MKKSKKVITYLNELLSINYETEKMFLCALKEVENTLVKNFLRVAGYERHQFIKSLDSNIRKKGGTPSYPAEFLNSSCELTSDLKDILSSKDYRGLLTAVGRKQVADIQKYQEMTHEFEFSDSIEQLLKSQQDSLVKSLYSVAIHKDLLARRVAS